MTTKLYTYTQIALQLTSLGLEHVQDHKGLTFGDLKYNDDDMAHA